MSNRVDVGSSRSSLDSTGDAEGHMPVEFFSPLEAVPDEEGNLFEVHLDAAAHGFGDKNPILVIDLDGCRSPELLFTL